MSIGKAAKYLGVSVDTLRRWEKKGRLTSDRSPGGHRFFQKAGLEKLFDKRYSRDALTQAVPKTTYVTATQETKPIVEPFTPANTYRPRLVVEEGLEQETPKVVPPAPTLVPEQQSQGLTPMQQEKLQIILSGDEKKENMTSFQKAAIVGLAVFVVVDIILVYLWYSSTRIISPVP